VGLGGCGWVAQMVRAVDS